MPRRKTTPRIVRMPVGDPKPGLTHEDMALVERSLQNTVSENTKIVYSKHFQYFKDWCQLRGIDPMEAEAEHVQAYLSRMFWTKGLDASTVQCGASAIKKIWLWGDLDAPDGERAPRTTDCDWAAVQDVVTGLRRERRRRPVRATGLTRERFQVILKHAWQPMPGESTEKATRRAAFDIALVAVMKDLMTRRTATSELVWGDIELRQRGERIFGLVTIPLGKRDRDGNPKMGYLSVDTLAYLYRMAEHRELDFRDRGQRVFGLKDRQISNRIKAVCRHVGLEGNFSGHSPRVGTAQDLGAMGATLLQVMQSGGWSSPEMAARYTEGEALVDGTIARYHRGLAEGRFGVVNIQEN